MNEWINEWMNEWINKLIKNHTFMIILVYSIYTSILN